VVHLQLGVGVADPMVCTADHHQERAMTSAETRIPALPHPGAR
jgi:hypothetical protein